MTDSFHMEPEEFRELGHEMVDWVADYLVDVEKYPVMSRVAPGEVRSALPDSAPEQPEPFADVMRDLNELYGMMQARDYGAAKELIAKLRSQARDFPTAKASSAIAGYTLASDLSIEKAKAMLLEGESEAAAKEIVAAAEIWPTNPKLDEFRERGAEVVGVSVDSHFSHLAWKNTPVDQGGIGDIQYPLVADLKKQISRDYGVLLEGGGVALRGTFLIDKEGVVKHAVINDLGLGRNIDEAIRMVDALKHHEQYGEVCPAN